MSRAGTTLIELLVALAVLAVVLGVSVVAFQAEPPPSAAELRTQRIAELRRRAIETGRPTAIYVDGAPAGTAYPDGRVLVPDSTIEPMSGRPVVR